MYRLFTLQSESPRTLKSLLALLFTITKELLKHSFPRKMSCLPLREQQKAKENRFVKMSNRNKICLKLVQNKKANADEQNTQRTCSTTVKEYQSLCLKLLFSQTYRTIYDNEINLVRNDCLHWNFLLLFHFIRTETLHSSERVIYYFSSLSFQHASSILDIQKTRIKDQTLIGNYD